MHSDCCRRGLLFKASCAAEFIGIFRGLPLFESAIRMKARPTIVPGSYMVLELWQ
jgi:hypothetical protein